jgi:hypothetical protein
MELAYEDWKALHNTIKYIHSSFRLDKFSPKEMKKNIIKYQDHIYFLVEKYPH